MTETKDYKISIDDVNSWSNKEEKVSGVTVDWSATIGFGQTTFYFEDGKILVDTEHMCTNDDKEFLKQVMLAFVSECEIVS